jgi:hypothetical protein
MSGSAATRECAAAEKTGAAGTHAGDADAITASGVGAVQDWHPHASSFPALAGMALADGAPESALLLADDDVSWRIDPISPSEAHSMPTPSSEAMQSNAEQPRHHTVMKAVKRAVSRERGDR